LYTVVGYNYKLNRNQQYGKIRPRFGTWRRMGDATCLQSLYQIGSDFTGNLLDLLAPWCRA